MRGVVTGNRGLQIRRVRAYSQAICALGCYGSSLVNRQIRQSSETLEMIFNIPKIITFLITGTSSRINRSDWGIRRRYVSRVLAGPQASLAAVTHFNYE